MDAIVLKGGMAGAVGIRELDAGDEVVPRKMGGNSGPDNLTMSLVLCLCRLLCIMVGLPGRDDWRFVISPVVTELDVYSF